MDVKSNGQVLAFPFFRSSSALLLLQADQHLVFHFSHIKNILQTETPEIQIPQNSILQLDTHTVLRHTDLWVLQKCGFMVNTASGAVAEGVVSMDPSAPHHLLLPGLVNTQIGCVYQSAQDQVGKVVSEVFKVHPGGWV